MEAQTLRAKVNFFRFLRHVDEGLASGLLVPFISIDLHGTAGSGVAVANRVKALIVTKLLDPVRASLRPSQIDWRTESLTFRRYLACSVRKRVWWFVAAACTQI